MHTSPPRTKVTSMMRNERARKESTRSGEDLLTQSCGPKHPAGSAAAANCSYTTPVICCVAAARPSCKPQISTSCRSRPSSSNCERPAPLTSLAALSLFFWRRVPTFAVATLITVPSSGEFSPSKFLVHACESRADSKFPFLLPAEASHTSSPSPRLRLRPLPELGARTGF